MNPHPTAPDDWETNAAWWQAEFTAGADPEYEDQILPLCAEHLAGARRVLEVGAGEGQVARVAAAVDGVELVVATDLAAGQIVEAARRGGGVAAARAGIDGLPFPEATFDAVVACLVFEHVDDHAAAVAEIARVLEPGGRFVLLVNHPLLATPDSGWIDDHMVDPPEQYYRVGDYLPGRAFVDEVSPGVHIRFVHRPLSDYVNTLADHGLVLRRMVEPAPPERFLAQAPGYRAAAAIPRLMLLDTAKAV